MKPTIRELGRYTFEGGGYVQITIGGDVPIKDALEMIETIVSMKREELAARTALAAATGGKGE
jgi:hypothetical protein